MGAALARGAAAGDAVAAIGHVVEGVATAPVLAELAAGQGVEMPITASVCALLDGRTTAPEAMAALLSRGLTRER